MTHRIPFRILLVAALAGLILPGAVSLARAQDQPGRKYALLVGVCRYKNNSLKSLKYAERDVEELATVLTSCGYEAHNIWQLTHKEAGKDPRWFPSRDNIVEALRLLQKDRNPADTLLVAFAGHGVQFQDDAESYFCPADADLRKKSTLLSLGEVYRELKGCKAGLKLVLVDACRNDPRADTSRAPAQIELQSPRFQRQQPPGGVAVLFSCSEGQEAFEDDDLRHGIFFHFVIEGLKGKAAGKDQTVTLLGLCNYVTTPVDDFVRKTKGTSQRPSLMGELSGTATLAVLDRGGSPLRDAVGEVRRLQGHTQVVSSVAFFPDGKRALSGSFDGTIRIWDIENGKELQRFTVEQMGWIWCAAVSPDGRLALCGGKDGTLCLWDVATGKPLQRLRGHDDVVCSVAFSPDGKSALSGSDDSTVRLWDVTTGKPLQCLRGHTDRVRSVAFSADGRVALSGSADGTVRLWNPADGKEVGVLRGHTDSVLSVAISRDGSRAVSAGKDRTVRLWDVAAGKELRCFRDDTNRVLGVALAPDGRRLLCAGTDRIVRLWDVETGEVAGRFSGHETTVQTVAFSPDGRHAVSGSGGFGPDNSVRLWRLPQ